MGLAGFEHCAAPVAVLAVVGIPAAVLWSAAEGGTPAAHPTTAPAFVGPPGAEFKRHGDEIVVCGRFFHTTAPVVLWIDPGGYDGYRLEKRFGPAGEPPDAPQTPAARYGIRDLSPEEARQVREAGWDLPLLARKVDKLVIHYDGCGTSRQCFRVLHDERGLSCHFLLDIDGTIYQTLDLKERAWHATKANARSIGIEIAGIGAHPPHASEPLQRWYAADAAGRVRIVPPQGMDIAGVRTAGFVGRPARPEPVTGVIHGTLLRQYDFTPEQYDSLIRLTATLCVIFPSLRCDYPRDETGRLITHVLTDEQLERFSGILGHYHVQANKIDPGPAFQWDRLIEGARQILRDLSAAPATRPSAATEPHSPHVSPSPPVR